MLSRDANFSPADDRRRVLLEFLDIIWKPGDVREVRVPRYNDYGTTAAGWFDAADSLADAALKWDGRSNVFVTLNPVCRDLLSRANNRILNRSDSTTADADVIRREWLFIDIDPIRPSGISSTDSELAAAKECAKTVASYLEARSWPDPVVAMSGNGYYLLYPMDLPNDAPATALVHAVLTGLSGKFSDERVHIDTSVSNAARDRK